MTLADRDRIAGDAEGPLAASVRAALSADGAAAADAIAAGRPVRVSAGGVLAAYLAHLPGPYAEAAALAFEDAERQTKRQHGRDDFMDAALAWVRREGAALVAYVTDTTRDLVRAFVAAGLSDGLNPRDIARQLRAEWPGVSRMRSERIARTEALRAANVGQTAGYARARDELGLELEKVWVATSDGRTRDSHGAANGQRVPFDEPFEVGGFSAMEPLDPALPASESVHCRCTYRVEVVGQKSWREVRNARIRSDYPALLKAEGQVGALATLAEREGLSESYVRDLVYKG